MDDAEIILPREKIRMLRAGNTALIDALMGMVHQFFIDNEDGTLRHSCMSAEEIAIDVLMDAGFAEETEKGYKLLWDKLKERQKEINSNG